MTKPLVLFLCTGNSARSQMAEAFLRKYAGDQFEVQSAGMNPREISPLTFQVMNEIGIDMAGHYSKSLHEFLGRAAVQYVIFVCEKAEESCPYLWPFTLQSFTWPFDDPAAFEGSDEARLEKFREVRDQIEERIRFWLAHELELLRSMNQV